MWRDLLLYCTAVGLPCVVLVALIHFEPPWIGMESVVIATALAAFTMVAIVMRRVWSALRFHSIWIGLVLLVLQIAACAMGIAAVTLGWLKMYGFEGVF